MNSALQFLFEVVIGSSILFAGYLLLRDSLQVKIKRIYLLCCIFLPLLLPVLQFQTDLQPVAYFPSEIGEVFTARTDKPEENDKPLAEPMVKTVSEAEQTPEEATSSPIDWTGRLTIAYFCVSFFFLIKLLFALYSIFLLKKNSEASPDPLNYRIVENEGLSGASFFGLIFINKNLLNSAAFDYIFTHEQVHKKQVHSLDILVSEFYLILFWINPVSWFLRKEIRFNAELEADSIVSKRMDALQYSKILVELSSGTKLISTLNPFSALHTKYRIRQILDHRQEHPARSFFIIPFALLAFWMVSCESDLSNDPTSPAEALKNVKTITTKYISHQKDTQNKDGKVVAVAQFLPDGSLDKITQHMSYPYDCEHPYEIHFWSDPIPENIPLILDGLHLGKAEYNFLYGNNWPKKYAAIAQNDHPIYKKSEMMNSQTEVELNASAFPKQIVSQIGRMELDSHSMIEEFDYTQPNLLNKFVSYIKYNPEMYNKFDSEEMRKRLSAKVNYTEFQFAYSGDQLTSVIESKSLDGEKSYHFEYNTDKLAQSTYFVDGKLYVTRNYFYNESGLKTRTEIYNVDGDPEYTIFYEYTYY